MPDKKKVPSAPPAADAPAEEDSSGVELRDGPEGGAVALSQVSSVAVAPRRMLRILVVDDNVDTAESLAQLLRLDGHQVEAAYNGPVALETGAAFHPEIVFLDIGLPGMDGYEVARRLRLQSPLSKALLIALTGYGRSDDRRLAKAAGFDHHLTKPVNADVLTELVNRVASVRE